MYRPDFTKRRMLFLERLAGVVFSNVLLEKAVSLLCFTFKTNIAHSKMFPLGEIHHYEMIAQVQHL